MLLILAYIYPLRLEMQSFFFIVNSAHVSSYMCETITVIVSILWYSEMLLDGHLLYLMVQK